MESVEKTALQNYLQVLAKHRRGNAPAHHPVTSENVETMPPDGRMTSGVAPPPEAPKQPADENLIQPPSRPSDSYPTSCPEVAGLTSVLAQHLRGLPEEHLDSVEKVAGFLTIRVLDYLERLDELRGSGATVRTVQRTKAHWLSRCPKGHLTDEYLWTHQCVGIICPECLSIYDPTECRLEPRSEA